MSHNTLARYFVNGLVVFAIFISLAVLLFLIKTHLSNAQESHRFSKPLSPSADVNYQIHKVESIATTPSNNKSKTKKVLTNVATTVTANDLISDPIENPSISLASTQSKNQPLATHLPKKSFAKPIDNTQPLPFRQTDEYTGHLSIAGKILDESGIPVAGIEITCKAKRLSSSESGQLLANTHEQWLYSNPDGSFQFDELIDGEYEISTRPTTIYPAARQIVRAGSTSANLILIKQRSLHIYGQTLSANGFSLEGVKIFASGQGPKATYSAANGQYELDLNFKSNWQSYSIRFQLDGFRTQRILIEKADWESADSLEINAQLEPISAVATLAGKVANTLGKPVSGELVKLYSWQLQRRHQTVTDQAGNFSFSDIEVADDYRLQLYPRGPFKDFEQNSLNLTENGLHLAVVLEPQAVGNISGQMLDIFGNPVPRFSFSMRSKNASRQPIQIVSDDGGYFSAFDVPYGELIFETRSTPFFIITGFHFNEDTETDINLILDKGSYELTGHILDTQDKPIPMAHASAIWSFSENGIHSRSRRKSSSDSDGFFRFTGLGPGEHKITVDVPGFKTAQITTSEETVGEVIIRLKEQ